MNWPEVHRPFDPDDSSIRVFMLNAGSIRWHANCRDRNHIEN